MRNTKKLASLILVVALVLAFAAPAFAVPTSELLDAAALQTEAAKYSSTVGTQTYLDAVQLVMDLKILAGSIDAAGKYTFNAGQTIDRITVYTALFKLVNGHEMNATEIALYKSIDLSKVFNDVGANNQYKYWYAAWAWSKGLTSGTSVTNGSVIGKFSPNATMKTAHAVNTLLNALGYNNANEGITGSANADTMKIILALEAGLFGDLVVNTNLTKGEFSYIISKTLTAAQVQYDVTKEGKPRSNKATTMAQDKFGLATFRGVVTGTPYGSTNLPSVAGSIAYGNGVGTQTSVGTIQFRAASTGDVVNTYDVTFGTAMDHLNMLGKEYVVMLKNGKAVSVNETGNNTAVTVTYKDSKFKVGSTELKAENFVGGALAASATTNGVFGHPFLNAVGSYTFYKDAAGKYRPAGFATVRQFGQITKNEGTAATATFVLANENTTYPVVATTTSAIKIGKALNAVPAKDAYTVYIAYGAIPSSPSDAFYYFEPALYTEVTGVVTGIATDKIYIDGKEYAKSAMADSAKFIAAQGKYGKSITLLLAAGQVIAEKPGAEEPGLAYEYGVLVNSRYIPSSINVVTGETVSYSRKAQILGTNGKTEIYDVAKINTTTVVDKLGAGDGIVANATGDLFFITPTYAATETRVLVKYFKNTDGTIQLVDLGNNGALTSPAAVGDLSYVAKAGKIVASQSDIFVTDQTAMFFIDASGKVIASKGPQDVTINLTNGAGSLTNIFVAYSKTKTFNPDDTAAAIFIYASATDIFSITSGVTTKVEGIIASDATPKIDANGVLQMEVQIYTTSGLTPFVTTNATSSVVTDILKFKKGMYATNLDAAATAGGISATGTNLQEAKTSFNAGAGYVVNAYVAYKNASGVVSLVSADEASTTDFAISASTVLYSIDANGKVSVVTSAALLPTAVAEKDAHVDNKYNVIVVLNTAGSAPKAIYFFADGKNFN